jgi:hypothetical protein
MKKITKKTVLARSQLWPTAHHARAPTCAVFSQRRSLYRPSPLRPEACWRQHGSLLAVGLNPMVQRLYRWDKTAPSGRENPSPHFLCLSLSVHARACGGWRRPTSPRAGAPPATASRPRRLLVGALSTFPSCSSTAPEAATGRSCPRPVASVEPAPATCHGSGRRHALCPRRGLSLSAVAEASPSTAYVLRPVPRHADAHWIERNGAITATARFAGEPVASTVSTFSPFCSLFLIRNCLGDFLLGF